MRTGSSCVVEVLDPGGRGSAAGGQGSGNVLRLAECSQDVPSDHLDALILAPPPGEQLGDQLRVAGDVLQPGGYVVHSVVVSADPDVADAGDLPDVLDVVGHVGECRSRAGMLSRVLGLHGGSP